MSLLACPQVVTFKVKFTSMSKVSIQNVFKKNGPQEIQHFEAQRNLWLMFPSKNS